MPANDPRAPHGPTRRDPNWLWILAAALMVARVATGLHEEQHPVRRADLVTWVPASQAVERAKATGKPILYDFSAEWCGPCQAMRNDVFADARHAAAIERLVIPVSVVDREREDGHNSALVDSLQRAHFVQAFPTLVIVDANGKALDRMEGFPGVEKYMEWMSRTVVKARLGGFGLSDTSGRAKLVFP